jgi:hypothetical protein
VSAAHRVRGLFAAVLARAQVRVFLVGLFLALRLRVFLGLGVQELLLARRLVLELRLFELLRAFGAGGRLE